MITTNLTVWVPYTTLNSSILSIEASPFLTYFQHDCEIDLSIYNNNDIVIRLIRRRNDK